GWWSPAERPPPQPDPILLEAERPAQSVPGRSGLPSIGRRPAPASDQPRPVSPPGGDIEEDTPLKPWMAVLGVFVLFQAGAIVHPVLGLLVLAAALVIAIRRWLRRRGRR
ncbi:RNA-directed DNA polymerase, partial [Methylobacterium sp. WL19]